MRDLDDVDRELIRLLLADARRPYSELAEAVDLSAPAVSDRVDRLFEVGVIERFTAALDRSLLAEGLDVAVTFAVTPGRTDEVHSALADVGGVEYIFATADGRVVVVATIPDGDVETHLTPAFDTGAIENVDVSPLVASDWYPGVADVSLALECAECGNTVTSEGATATLDGDRYEFCCRSCEARFVERYETLKDGA